MPFVLQTAEALEKIQFDIKFVKMDPKLAEIHDDLSEINDDDPKVTFLPYYPKSMHHDTEQ